MLCSWVGEGHVCQRSVRPVLPRPALGLEAEQGLEQICRPGPHLGQRQPLWCLLGVFQNSPSPFPEESWRDSLPIVLGEGHQPPSSEVFPSALLVL